ncbi:MAG: 5-demethoxyubiquinol-8 5-hydroxylase UbiM [Gammaproteobacteria bacterium]|nr:MAG: 5-demethoxyubiquinol-8 5-hydroxylase UbiM [Gammaproteobacteria bacterium]
MEHDIIIIGAGPAGLSCARSLADTNLNVLIVEKSSLAQIRKPAPDGREIALTHLSVKLLRELGVWLRIPAEEITAIKKASVMDGDSAYSLNFANRGVADDVLGYMVSNHVIRKALYDEVATLDNVKILTHIVVEDVSTDNQSAVVTFANSETRKARLVVAADSRFSETRRKMGIPAKMRDFSRVAIVCRMEHEKSHHDTATECFHYGRTLAVLPLSGNTSSIVITVSTDLANAIVNMDEDEFNADIQQRFGNRLGWMKLIGKRYPYPLVAVHADKFATQRFALIGDAAVGMHPVTAHGFNLGLRGQNTLAREIKSALSQGKDFGSLAVLKKYESKHMRITWPMYLGTNGIVSLFTNDAAPVKAIRSLVLRLANNLPPIKHLITRSLTEKGNNTRGKSPLLP